MHGAAAPAQSQPLPGPVVHIPEIALLQVRLDEANARMEMMNRHAQSTLWIAGMMAAAMIGFSVFTAYSVASFYSDASRHRVDLERDIGLLRVRMEADIKALEQDLDEHRESLEDTAEDVGRMASRLVLMEASDASIAQD